MKRYKKGQIRYSGWVLFHIIEVKVDAPHIKAQIYVLDLGLDKPSIWIHFMNSMFI